MLLICSMCLNFLRELCNLNARKSTGLGGIPARFLKDDTSVLKIQITYIVNLSIYENKVPDEMRLTIVKPLY